MLRRALVLLTLLTSGLAVAALVRSLSRSPRAEASPLVEVAVEPVPLDLSDPARSSVGLLHYKGGVSIRSADPRFGGLSDLRVSPDGGRLLAVSDCGRGLTAVLTYSPDGRLAGLAEARLVDLGSGRGGTGEVDAESLVVGKEGIEVAFEGRRGGVRAYGLDPPFARPSRRLPSPPGLSDCGSNGGLETMTATADGRRLLVCESRRGASSQVPAWVGRGGAWTAREYPLDFDGGWMGEPFRPAGAALLPGGDVLIVERRFPPIGVRVVRLSRASLAAAAGPFEPVEVARIETPLTVDNFEGVEARRDAVSGRTLVYLLSDDNGCAKEGAMRIPGLQRTLLMMFALDE
jgi:hypothetical protein